MFKKISLFFAVISAVVLASCSKMGALSPENFKVTPTPLEAIGGEVAATINGTFPEKYMKKKAVVTVTPVLKYADGETVSTTSATFQGEKVEGNNTTISYKVGGNYTMKCAFGYEPAMLQSDLYLRFEAKKGKKTITIPEVKIGYGIIATSALLANTLNTTNAAIAQDAFQRIIKERQEANIKFLINQANVRSSELKSNSIQDFVKMLKEINDDQEGKALNNIEISAYASPDGAFDLNQALAEKRQNASEKYINKELKKNKIEANVDTKYTAEDWDGFQKLVAASSIQDKELILRVLSMYQEPEERERQIRNMSAVYQELADGILPELRRARLTINYELIGRSDDQIIAQFNSDAKQLSVEELIYGANMLMEKEADKNAWFTKTAEIYPNDYRAYNNLAALAYGRGEIAKAETYLISAKTANANAAEVNTNLALVALKKGDVQGAEAYIGKGTGADAFNEVLGNINIAKGNYDKAAASLAKCNTNSAALAQLLAKDYASALATLNNVKNADATTYYLKAVVAARTNDAGAVNSNLATAIAKDASLGERALKDIEFEKYANTVKGLIK